MISLRRSNWTYVPWRWICFSVLLLVGAATNADEGKEYLRYEFDIPQQGASNVAVSPDGRLLATSIHNKEGLLIWDLEQKKPVRKLPMGIGASWGFPIVFSSDGKRLLTPDSERSESDPGSIVNARLWSTVDWTPAGPNLELAKNQASDKIRASDDLSVIASASRLRIFVFSSAIGKPIREMSYPDNKYKFSDPLFFVKDVAVRPDGKELAAAVNLRYERKNAGGRAVVVKEEFEIHVWDVERGTIMRKINTGAFSFKHLIYSQDGKLLAFVPDYAAIQSDQTKFGLERLPTERRVLDPVTIWEADTGRLLYKLAPPRIKGGYYGEAIPPISMIRFVGDGRHLIMSHDDGYVRVWDVPKQAVVQDIAYPDAYRGDFAIVSGRLAVNDGSGRQVRIWKWIRD